MPAKRNFFISNNIKIEIISAKIMIFLKRERKIGLFLNFPSLIHTDSPIFYIFASLILKKIVNNTQKK